MAAFHWYLVTSSCCCLEFIEIVTPHHVAEKIKRGLSHSRQCRAFLPFKARVPFSTLARAKHSGGVKRQVLPDVEHASMAREDALMQYENIRHRTEASTRERVQNAELVSAFRVPWHVLCHIVGGHIPGSDQFSLTSLSRSSSRSRRAWRGSWRGTEDPGTEFLGFLARKDGEQLGFGASSCQTSEKWL